MSVRMRGDRIVAMKLIGVNQLIDRAARGTQLDAGAQHSGGHTDYRQSVDDINSHLP